MVRWTRSLVSLASSLALLSLFAVPALADGTEREEPLTPMDTRPEVVVETPTAVVVEPPKEETVVVTKVSRRNWTACKQLRTEIHMTDRDYYHRRSAERREAYWGMRAGDIEPRYLGQHTLCTPCREHQLEHRLAMLMKRTSHLEQFIEHHPLGVLPGYPFPGGPIDGKAGHGWMPMGMLSWDVWPGHNEHWATHPLYPDHNEIEPPGRPVNKKGYHVGRYRGDRQPQ